MSFSSVMNVESFFVGAYILKTKIGFLVSGNNLMAVYSIVLFFAEFGQVIFDWLTVSATSMAVRPPPQVSPQVLFCFISSLILSNSLLLFKAVI